MSIATLAFGLVPAAFGADAAGWLLAGAFSLLRAAQGAFSALVQTGLLAAIASSFEEGGGRGKAIAAGELAGSFGWTLAPALGAVLFETGGFVTPFAVFAAVPLVLLPALIGVFPTDSSASAEQGEEAEASVFSAATWHRFGRLVSYSRLLVLASVASTFACWSAFDMGFVPWLTVKEGYSLSAGGWFFAVAPFWYGACSIPAGCAVDMVERKKNLIALGFLSQVVSFGAYWPVVAPMERGTTMTITLVVVMSVCGMGAPLLIVPAMPDMLLGLAADDAECRVPPVGDDAEATAPVGDVSADVESERDINTVSAMYNFASALGNAAGPAISASLHSAGQPFPVMITAIACFEAVLMLLILRFEAQAGAAGNESYSVVALDEVELARDAHAMD